MSLNVIKHSSQQGAALIVALVALLILTILGVSTMSDVMNQSSVVRNEQFRQKVFYAANSELNVQIDSVNNNAQNEDDKIITDLLATSFNGEDMELKIEDDQEHKNFTTPVDVVLSNSKIDGVRADRFGCPGETIGKIKVIAGNIDTTASLDDGRSAGGSRTVRSVQTQRYIYCWP